MCLNLHSVTILNNGIKKVFGAVETSVRAGLRSYFRYCK